MTTAETHTLTGAYVLDAIGDFERTQFERHLGGCDVCAQEVRELRAVAARLGAAVGTDPAPGLRAGVLAQITVTRQDPPIVREPRPTPGLSRRWRTRAAIITGAVAAVAAGLVGGVVLTGDPSSGTPSPAVSAEQPIRTAPDAVTVTAHATTGGTGTAQASRILAKVAVSLDGVPALDRAHSYQVWLLGTHGARSAGLLRPGAGTLISTLPADVDHVAVTTEPASGSTQPTSPGVLAFDLD